MMNDSNSSSTIICRYNFCVEVTLHRQILGTLMFVVVWPFIVLDFKLVPLGRPAAALLGGVFMVITTVVPQDQVFAVIGDEGNLQTICLLIGMMFLSYYYDREGILKVVALWIFGKNRPLRSILWKVCILAAVLSAIITNDATCVVLTPLLLKQHKLQDRSHAELPVLLLGIATSANIGSAATFFGNPQNAFIAANSKGMISLVTFFATSLPAALIGILLNTALLYCSYFKVIFFSHNDTADRVEAIDYPTSNGHPKTTCNGDVASHHHTVSINTEPAVAANQVQTPRAQPQRWKTVAFLTWLITMTVVLVVLLAVPPPPTVSVVSFNLGLVPFGIGVLTMLMDTLLLKRTAYDVISKIDWGLILMFFGLFVWLQGFENTGFPDQLLKLLQPYMDLLTIQGVLLYTAFIAILSNIISNVPLVILVVHNISHFQCGTGNSCPVQLTGVLLAWVSTIAGNFTLIGSVANLIVAEKGRNCANYHLTFWTYIKFGFISSLVVLFTGLPIVYYTGKFVRI